MSQTIKTQIEISGMTCPACEKLIGRRLSKIDGVTQVKVDVKGENAQVEGTRKISTSEIQSMLEGTQYQVISIH